MLPLRQALWACLACFFLLASHPVAGASLPLVPRGSPSADDCFAAYKDCTSRAHQQIYENNKLTREMEELSADIDSTIQKLLASPKCGYLGNLYNWYNHLPLERREVGKDPKPVWNPNLPLNGSNPYNSTQPLSCAEKEICEYGVQMRGLELAAKRANVDALRRDSQQAIDNLQTCAFLHGPSDNSSDTKPLVRRGCHMHPCQKTEEHDDAQQALQRCDEVNFMLKRAGDAAYNQQTEAESFVKAMSVSDWSTLNHAAGNKRTSSSVVSTGLALQETTEDALRIESRGRNSSNPNTEQLKGYLKDCKEEMRQHISTIANTYHNVYATQQEWTGNLTPRKRDVQPEEIASPYADAVPEEDLRLNKRETKEVTNVRFGMCELDRDFWHTRYLQDIADLGESRREFIAQGWRLAKKEHADAMSAVKAHQAKTSTTASTVTHSATVTHTVTVSVTEESTKTQTAKPSSESPEQTGTVGLPSTAGRAEHTTS